jgi:hypothetical protein
MDDQGTRRFSVHLHSPRRTSVAPLKVGDERFLELWTICSLLNLTTLERLFILGDAGRAKRSAEQGWLLGLKWLTEVSG